MAELEINGNLIHWESLGTGEPVMLLNGVLMTLQSWTLQTSALRRHYRCLLHDFRGQLLSAKQDRSWTMADHADDLEKLLDHLEIDRCHVVGTSYGGEVGMIFAASSPERVKSLSVISSVSEVGRELDKEVSSWRQAALEAPETLYQTMIPTTFSPDFVASNPGVVEQGEERLRSCDRDFFQGLGRLIDAFRQLDITSSLHQIRCPTLVVVGERDILKPPRYSQLIAREIEGSELVLIPGGGHAVILEQPQVVNEILLSFLDSQGGSSG